MTPVVSGSFLLHTSFQLQVLSPSVSTKKTAPNERHVPLVHLPRRWIAESPTLTHTPRHTTPLHLHSSPSTRNFLQTTDFFYPLVDDPYVQGQIAAANVLSDLYAMGVADCDNVLMLLAVSMDMPQEYRQVHQRRVTMAATLFNAVSPTTLSSSFC